MKKELIITISVTATLLLLSFNIVMAQDWKNQNPKMNHILADTTFLHATEVILLPEEKSDTHTHPAHFFMHLPKEN